MHVAVIGVAAGAGSLLFLLVLFHFERRRGARFFERARRACDRGVLWLYRFFSYIGKFIERDTLRQVAHFVFHQILKALLGGVRLTERNVDRLLRTNRAIARKTARKQTDTPSMLEKVAEHKVTTSLSDTEKRKRKEKSIGTRL